MSTIPRFIALPYSPWSIKARWALEHHEVPYRYVTYLPMLGEPFLRIATGQLRGRVTVPVLITDEGPITDSFDIARWAERNGSGSPLFPAEHLDDIVRWNERSERVFDAARALSVEAMSHSPAALAENVPGPRAIATRLTAVGALGVRYIKGKYDARLELEQYRERIREGMKELERALDGRDHVLSVPTYADVAMTIATWALRPPGRRYDKLGDASRACWSQPALASEFADLLVWRDRMLERSPLGRTKS